MAQFEKTSILFREKKQPQNPNHQTYKTKIFYLKCF